MKSSSRAVCTVPSQTLTSRACSGLSAHDTSKCAARRRRARGARAQLHIADHDARPAYAPSARRARASAEEPAGVAARARLDCLCRRCKTVRRQPSHGTAHAPAREGLPGAESAAAHILLHRHRTICGVLPAVCRRTGHSAGAGCANLQRIHGLVARNVNGVWSVGKSLREAAGADSGSRLRVSRLDTFRAHAGLGRWRAELSDVVHRCKAHPRSWTSWCVPPRPMRHDSGVDTARVLYHRARTL